MIDEAIEEITKMLIKQDIKDKQQKNIETITITKVGLYKFSIKLLKVIKKCL